jgi:hypothetical protein
VSCFAYSSPSLSTEYFSRSSCTISLSDEGQRQLFRNGLEVCHFILLYLDRARYLSGLSYILNLFRRVVLTLILLTWRIWWAPNNASRRQMRFNSAFKGLIFWHRSFTFNSNHQRDATVFQFIILTFVYGSICFGHFPAHHQELNDCSGSLWFYLRIVATVVLCAGRPDHEHSTTVTTIRR